MGVIYWKEQNNRFGAIKVLNKGDISEAFLHSLFSTSPKLGARLETNIGRFAHKIIEVDNTSGILSGDFMSQDKKIQYAAKSCNASMVQITQIVELANQIVQGKIYSINQLKKIQKEKIKSGSLRNYLISDMKEIEKDLIKHIKSDLSIK